ncbi:MAG: hypothetical protein COW13_00555 [Candidatus Omnitrophica bacterium CG12_big_fil_rev_8_21_14_0_65_50_5]|nr:MAG: hypothetical protein COW13_00555 [Candidatus Omnitrophica bacterium CG12_big_fil_rev_8_21_14_0_65_50_5]
MPLGLLFLPSFERSLKSLDAGQKETVRLLLQTLTIYYASNCDLFEARKIAPRFFYKQLRRPFYEAGVEGKLRLVIRREGAECFAILVGNHDQVKRFLVDQ